MLTSSFFSAEEKDPGQEVCQKAGAGPGPGEERTGLDAADSGQGRPQEEGGARAEGLEVVGGGEER